MTYNLATKLKIAGFPQPYDRGTVYDVFVGEDEYRRGGDEIPKEYRDKYAYIPKIEELMHEIGKYVVIEQYEFGWRAFWRAQPFQSAVGMDAIDVAFEKGGNGIDCLEALAHLYINKNGSK